MFNEDGIQRIFRLSTELQLANILTKRGANTGMLLVYINSGQINFELFEFIRPFGEDITSDGTELLS